MSVVLNIGGDIGALILYAPAAMDGQEIEISRRPGGSRRHTVVRHRDTSAADDYAAVYPDLPAGDYTVWLDDRNQAMTTTITGGSVTTCRWPD
jgi:hypothetical protein